MTIVGYDQMTLASTKYVTLDKPVQLRQIGSHSHKSV